MNFQFISIFGDENKVFIFTFIFINKNSVNKFSIYFDK